MTKQVQEMVEKYRHLFLLRQKLANNGAVDKANDLEKQSDEILKILKEAGYPVRALIEEAKYEIKKMQKYERIIVFSDGGVRNHHDSEQESKAASAFILYGDNERLKQQGKYMGGTYTLPSGTEVEVNSTLAEYAGLLQGMDHILENHITASKYIFVTDCAVVVEQISNKRNPSNPSFQECLKSCKEKMRLLGDVEIKHVTRENNRWADALVNDILNEHERVSA